MRAGKIGTPAASMSRFERRPQMRAIHRLAQRAVDRRHLLERHKRESDADGEEIGREVGANNSGRQ